MNGTADVESTVLTPAECIELLGQATVGRIGVSIDALPVIMPVRFSLLDQSVIFHTRPGSKLDAATNGAVIAFQADAFEPHGLESWSVLLQGMAGEITDARELAEARSVAISPWPTGSDTERWMRIRTGTINGRTFRSARRWRPIPSPDPAPGPRPVPDQGGRPDPGVGDHGTVPWTMSAKTRRTLR